MARSRAPRPRAGRLTQPPPAEPGLPPARHVAIIGSDPVSLSPPPAPPAATALGPDAVGELSLADRLSPPIDRDRPLDAGAGGLDLGSPAASRRSVQALAAGPRPGRGRAPVRRTPWLLAVVAVAALTTSFIVQGFRAVPTLSLHAGPLASVTVAGSAPVIPWPSTGEAALAIPATGTLVASGTEVPVPIASITKVMTAYLVLRDHPMTPAEPGPSLVMTATDVQDSANDAQQGATSVPITLGETFTERQLLDGLIVHSANDFALALSRFDAGSVDAFVVKMNDEAKAMGMAQTHYVSPDGLEATDVSTASDQLKLADVAMTIPAFAAVADQAMISYPGVGALANYVTDVGQFGVVGLKSGFTQAAMGCVIMAAHRTVAGHDQLVLAAVTGQGGLNPIATAQSQTLAIIDAAAPVVVQAPVLRRGQPVGSVMAPWGGPAHYVVSAAGLVVTAWPGQVVTFSVHRARLARSVASGTVVGTLSVNEGGHSTSVPLIVTSSVSGPSWRWRYTRP